MNTQALAYFFCCVPCAMCCVVLLFFVCFFPCFIKILWFIKKQHRYYWLRCHLVVVKLSMLVNLTDLYVYEIRMMALKWWCDEVLFRTSFHFLFGFSSCSIEICKSKCIWKCMQYECEPLMKNVALSIRVKIRKKEIC